MKIKNTLLTILTFVLLVISAFDTHNASAVAIESNLYLPWSYTKDAMRTAGYHEGYAIDFVLSPNGDRKTAPILAVQDGNVVFAQDNISTNCKYPTKCTANIIVIRHTNGRYSWYYHLKYKSIPPHLKPSKSNPTPKVSTGEVIAIHGNTGSVGDPSGS